MVNERNGDFATTIGNRYHRTTRDLTRVTDGKRSFVSD